MLNDAQAMKDNRIAEIEKLFQEMTSEIHSTHKAHTSALVQDKNKLNDIIVKLNDRLMDIHKMKGDNVDTKVFLKMQNILEEVEQFRFDAEMLRLSAMNVEMTLPTSFKMESISIGTSQTPAAMLVPEISFPISPVRSLPVPQWESFDDESQLSYSREDIASLHHIKAQKLESYNLTLDNDKKNCLITGIAITNDGRRLMADYNNSKIKLFARDMNLLCSMSLSSTPWDVAVTGDREAVVSYFNKEKLLILYISDRKMNIKRNVKLPFAVSGITSYKDKLLVTSMSTSPASVKLIDQSGRVYWSTDTDQQGRQLLNYPEYLTYYDDGASAAVIISDNNNILTWLNADTGDVITRRPVMVRRPKGVTTDTMGNVCVCYYMVGEVAVLVKDLSEEKVILSQRDGLSSLPRAIVYNAVDNQLLVSNTSCSMSTIDCFKL